jgi:hypothetical protein
MLVEFYESQQELQSSVEPSLLTASPPWKLRPRHVSAYLYGFCLEETQVSASGAGHWLCPPKRQQQLWIGSAIGNARHL